MAFDSEVLDCLEVIADRNVDVKHNSADGSERRKAVEKAPIILGTPETDCC